LIVITPSLCLLFTPNLLKKTLTQSLAHTMQCKAQNSVQIKEPGKLEHTFNIASSNYALASKVSKGMVVYLDDLF